MESNRVYLPSDMVIEILLKLPVKSIIRFKSVAKTWYHLFHDSSFISQHLSVSKNNKLLLVCYQDHKTDALVTRVSDLDGQTALSYSDLHQPLKDHGLDKIIFVDNGLVCLQSSIKCITIWNPATKEFRILPEFNIIVTGYSSTYIIALGFALDPLSNDYKLVCLRYSFRVIPNSIEWITEYVVYQMSTDSWRVLTMEVDKFGVPTNSHYWDKCKCVNGVLYWEKFCHFYRADATENQILAFDLGPERFRIIQLPMPLTESQEGTLIQLSHGHVGFWDDKRSYDLWMLNDDQESWTKLRKIEPCSEITKIYGSWKNGHIFVRSWSEKVLIYDLETGKFMETGIQIETEQRERWSMVCPYEETLLSISRGRESVAS